MTSASDLTRLVPGFDFLQGLMKGGGAGLPGIGQWIAPTLEPAELQKRIDELRTVQFWLDQNSKLLGTTIQALEVQRMTLATLQGMNLRMTDLADSLKVKPAAASPSPAPAPAPAPAARGFSFGAPASTADEDAEPDAPAPAAAKPRPKAASAAEGGASAGAVDPMQWWGALTQQFTELAAKAMKDSGGEVARTLADAATQQGLQATETSIERMMALSSRAAEMAAQTGTAVAGAMGAAAQRAGAAKGPAAGKAAQAAKPAKPAKPAKAAKASAAVPKAPKSAPAPSTASAGTRRRGA